jgi:hypothetical protein
LCLCVKPTFRQLSHKSKKGSRKERQAPQSPQSLHNPRLNFSLTLLAILSINTPPLFSI